MYNFFWRDGNQNTQSIFSITSIEQARQTASALTYNRLKNSQAVTNILNGHSLQDQKDGSYFNTNSREKIAGIVHMVIQNATHYEFDISHSSHKPFLALSYDLPSTVLPHYVDNYSHVGHDSIVNSSTNNVIVCFGFGTPPKADDIRVLAAYPSTTLEGCHK